MAGWKKHYGDMIEWVSAANGGKVEPVTWRRAAVVTRSDWRL